MPVYFLVHDADLFSNRITPALTASWRRRSFAFCRELCVFLLPAALAFRHRYHTGTDEPLLARIIQGLPFDRDLWRLLVGEVLLYAALDVPELQTAPETLARLVGGSGQQPGDTLREHWPPIWQAHLGSQELLFGTFYRPEHAGFNGVADVRRLAAHLDGIDPAIWTTAALRDLAGPDAEDQEEELAFARDCFAGLRGLYQRAGNTGQVIVSEWL
jgi:hypothetical protein